MWIHPTRHFKAVNLKETMRYLLLVHLFIDIFMVLPLKFFWGEKYFDLSIYSEYWQTVILKETIRSWYWQAIILNDKFLLHTSWDIVKLQGPAASTVAVNNLGDKIVKKKVISLNCKTISLFLFHIFAEIARSCRSCHDNQCMQKRQLNSMCF